MSNSSTATKEKFLISIEDPLLYKVIILNDNHTTVDFVVHILMSIFNKSYQDAVEITHHVHNNGSGECGIYVYDIAKTKVKEALKVAKRSNFPLKLIYKKN